MQPSDQGPRGHLHEPAGHVDAAEADLDYFRRKRLEPRVLHCLRRGVIGFADLLRADRALTEPVAVRPDAAAMGLDAGVRAVEDELDRLVRGIAEVTVAMRAAPLPIEDTRKERGDYDGFFRLAPRPHRAGSLADRLEVLAAELADCHRLLAAFTAALLATGRVSPQALADRRAQLSRTGHHGGARIVARAWVDPGFKDRLLTTGRDAVRELDIPPGRLGLLGVAENTAEVHNVVVCTLCSCYPHDLLGDPPWWYRTDEYKERIITEPRIALAQLFGLELPPGVRIRVHDSTSDVRWMVLPRRPEGTAGWAEDQLADLVSPASLVGAGLALTPAAAAR